MADPERIVQRVEFSAWIRGGEPGPDNQSDLLEAKVVGDACDARYTAARFHFEPAPGYRTEVFAGALPTDVWTRIATTLVEERVFAQRWPSEGRGQLADAVKITVILVTPAWRYEKTFFESDSQEFPQFKAAVSRAMEYLRSAGRPG